MTCNAVPPKGPDGLNQIDILRTQGRESVQVAGSCFSPCSCYQSDQSAQSLCWNWHRWVARWCNGSMMGTLLRGQKEAFWKAMGLNLSVCNGSLHVWLPSMKCSYKKPAGCSEGNRLPGILVDIHCLEGNQTCVWIKWSSQTLKWTVRTLHFGFQTWVWSLTVISRPQEIQFPVCLH